MLQQLSYQLKFIQNIKVLNHMDMEQQIIIILHKQIQLQLRIQQLQQIKQLIPILIIFIILIHNIQVQLIIFQNIVIIHIHRAK